MASQLPANINWFPFTSATQGFSIFSFKGVEEINKPYEFDVELVHSSSEIDIGGMIGSDAYFSIFDRSGGERLIHGIIRDICQLHRSNSKTHYRVLIVPKLWFLGQRINHRIFQNKDVTSIISTLLSEQRFSAESFEFKCFHQYEPREYCVQYGESDLHFITRLCEEEGIFFYFEHFVGGHKLCFFDTAGGQVIPGENDLRYFPGSGNREDTAVISRINLRRSARSNEATFREWNFEKPKLNLTANIYESDQESAPRVASMVQEIYQFPHLYQLQETGRHYAELQLLRQLSFSTQLEGEADVSRFLPGFTFSIYEHPREDVNSDWWVFRVEHCGQQPQSLGNEAPDRGMDYKSTFVAIPKSVRYVPELQHQKRLIIGKQTAIVVGPPGEEIFPDEHGRVKVQFHWDRLDKYNDKASCWVRVTQGWAGSQFGMIAIPRIGHEVVVSFLEGNPDRPLITGRVFNALNMPPYELPEHKTRTIFRSMSTPHIEGEPSGFNELRIEDRRGEEEIYVRAQRDMNIYASHDWKNNTRNEKHETVGGNSFTTYEQESHLVVRSDRKTEICKQDNLTVRGDSHTLIEKDYLVKAGKTLVLESSNELVLKVGGTLLKLNPAGIFTSGALSMEIGVSSPRTAAPLLPDGSSLVSKIEVNQKTSMCKTLQLNNASETGQPLVNSATAPYACKE